MALDLTFDDGRVHTTNVGISLPTVSQYMVDFICINVQIKTTFGPRRDRWDKIFLTNKGRRPQSLIQAALKEQRLTEGSKVVRTRHWLGGGVGG